MPRAKERPILHIGYHKTATTWFQQRFYPAVANGAFIDRELARETLVAPNAFAFSAPETREALMAAAGGRRPLICEENLSGYIHNGGLGRLLSKEIAHRLHATFPDAIVVVFLRSQPDIVEAAYAQYVRGGGTHSPRRYVNGQEKRKGAARHWYKAPLFSLDHFDYQPLLEHYAQLFGRENLFVYLYEEFTADPRAFMAWFCEALALDCDVASLDFGRLNPSLTLGEARILRHLNLLTSRSVLDKRYYADVEDWYAKRWRWLTRFTAPTKAGPSKRLLPPKLRQQIADHFGEANRQLARDWSLPLERHGYPISAVAV